MYACKVYVLKTHIGTYHVKADALQLRVVGELDSSRIELVQTLFGRGQRLPLGSSVEKRAILALGRTSNSLLDFSDTALENFAAKQVMLEKWFAVAVQGY